MDRAASEPSETGSVPTGTVTFLFTDIEGSTQRWDRFPAAMQRAVADHDRLARAALVAHRGHIFKALGDAFCCAFTLPADAVAAALAVQSAIGAEDFADVDGLRVRIALHTGSADERDGDYFGPTLNRVARLLAIAHGGQTIVSGVTHDLALGSAATGAQFTDLGTHGLRDLAQPERVYQLGGPGLRSAFPPLRSLANLPNNLPIARTSFVGREREVDEIAALLGMHRLVTLTGTGGIGKTRASLQVAAHALDAFRDGVWLIELAPLSSGALVAETVATTLGITLSNKADSTTALVTALRSQSVLLVFDNCEHLVADVADLIAAILRSAPNVRVLASSRERLKLTGEVTYRMPTLSVPTESQGAALDVESALGFGAIALFVDRATAADRRFALTDRNASIVADIVRRLDGIALAIELAAPRTKILDLSQLRSRLDERFRLLTGGSRDVLPRQQTLRALIDWSYELLDERERLLFARTSVFVDGFTLDAAIGVCTDDEIDEFDLLDSLTSLVEKSLIVADASADTTRYRLLESTRAYAMERQIAGDAQRSIAAKHARWFADAVDRWYEAYWSTPTLQWLPDVTPELDNIRAALRWALDPGGDSIVAARIAGGLEGLWFHGALSGEGRRWIDAVFARLDDGADERVVAVLWLTLARLSVAKGMVHAANRAIALLDRGPASPAGANAYHMLAIGLRRMGRFADAETAIDRALALYETVHVTSTWPYVKALDTRAGIVRFAGRIAEARALRSDALARFERLGDEHGAAGVRVNLADLEVLDGDPRRAIELSEEAARSYHDVGEAAGEAIALINVAAFRILLDEFDAAESAARRGLSLALRAGWVQGIAIAVQHLASVAAARHEPERAAGMVGFVDAWYASESFAREPTEQRCYERVMAMLAAQLSPSPLQALIAGGAGLSVDVVVRDALDVGRRALVSQAPLTSSPSVGQ